jgi:NAD(P)-dependent dehydrogenase (short-subunit alcohol dehydrogenase family)/acyl carrier protein
MSFVVKLNGSNYVSEKRQRAFEEALKDGHQIQLRRGSGNGASAPNPVAPSPARSRPVPVAGPLDHGLLENLELGLARSYEHQKQTLRVHEQYLHNQGDYATIFSQLMQQQHAIFSNGNGAAAPTEATLQALENISHSIEQFHEHQSDTLGVHRQFLDEQATYAQAFIRLLQEQCDAMLHSSGNGNGNVSGRVGESLNQRMNESAVQRTSVGWDGIPTDEAPEPPAAPVSEASPSAAPEDVGRDGIPTDEAPVASAVDVETLTQSLLATVSDKTGYPPEMLELDMDMEADLGIDSIKRVEILSALRDQHPDLPEVGAEALTELRTLGQIIDFMQERGAEKKVSRARQQEHSIRRDGVALSPLPAPDFLKFQLPAGHCCLITDDGSGASAELAAILSQRGWSVVLMSFPSSIVAASTPPELPPEVVRVALPSTSEGHLREQLAAIAETHGPVGAFVHVHPHTDEHERLAYFDDRERALVKAVFLMAKHLQPALTEAVAQEDERAVFLTVTRMDGALGLSEPSETDVMAGGLAGLTKALRLEWPSVFCRAVDVAPALAPERAAQAIFAELHDPNRRIVEVGVRPASRSTIIRGGVGRTCGPKALWPRDSIPTTPTTDQPASPDADAVFLVSGGAKGITAQCVVAAARRYHSAFVLVGRSAHPDEGGPEPAWSAGVMDEKALKQRAMTHLAESGERPTPKQIRRMVKAVRSRREIRETLAAIEQAGGRAVYVSADVTDGAALRAGVEAALEQLGAPQITGLVHGAGAIADKPIQQKSADDFELVYGVKIDGLKNLLSCAPPETLTHVALFSSVAGFYGNAAQTDYALANEILNKIAHQLRREHPACHVRAIDWGPW